MIRHLWRRGATLATSLATVFSLITLFIAFRNRKRVIWQEVMSVAKHKKESKRKIIRSILIVCVPITISSILAVATKSIDAFTVVRILGNYIGAESAQIQYGILSGKVEMLITLPFSFNIAFATALVPGIASLIAAGKYMRS